MRRAVTKSIILSAVVASLAIFPAETVVRASSVTVTAGVPDNIANNSNCSLREAVFAALNNAARDACPAGSATDTDIIQLESGKLYVLALTGSDDANNSGDIDFFDDDGTAAIDLIVKSNGDAPATIVQQVSGERVFDSTAGLVVQFENVIIQGGSGGSGSGFRNLDGAATFDRVTFRDNVASSVSAFGGALWSSDIATALVTGSAFYSNVSESGYGGAIFTYGQLSVADSYFSGNFAWSGGGAIGVYNAGANIRNSTFHGSTTAGSDPSASDIQALQSATVTVNNSTFAGGSAASGAVITAEDGAVVTVANSIVAAADAATPPCLAVDGGAFTAGHNRVHVLGTDCDGTAAALLTADSLTAPDDYGGHAPTMLLTAGSSALDGGDPGSCEAYDSRGVERRLGDSLCDIGAVEMFRLSLSAPSSTTEGGEVSYTVAVAPTVPAGMSIPVFMSTQQGSALPGVDYVETTQLLTFDSADSQHDFSVTHLEDDIDEDDEIYGIAVFQTAGLALPVGPFFGTITDDDTVGVLIEPETTFNAIEGAEPLARALELMSRPAADIQIDAAYSTDDLTLTGFPIVVAPEDWGTPVNFGVGAVDDLYDEGGELEQVILTVISADPKYDGLALPTLNVTVIEADANLIANGGFEQNSLGDADPADKQAVGWTALPKASGKSRRNCDALGDGSLCAWQFKGRGVAFSVRQALTPPVYAVGDYLVAQGTARRANISAGISMKLQVSYHNGQRDSVKYKFAPGTDAGFTPFARQIALNQPKGQIASAVLVFNNAATAGKLYLDDIRVALAPRFPREPGGVLPLPAAPPGMRGMN